MERKLISAEELLLIINNELKKHEECEECHVKGITRLAELDGGCNWSSSLYLSGSGGEICAPIAREIIRDLRDRYNIS